MTSNWPKLTSKLAFKVEHLFNSTFLVTFQKVPMVIVEDSEYKHVAIGLKKKSSNTVAQTSNWFGCFQAEKAL